MRQTNMANNFKYDVFLSHSSKDKAVVRPLAERLRRHMRRAFSQLSTLNHQRPGAPLNKERRFIPLRLEDAPIKGCLGLIHLRPRPGHARRPQNQRTGLASARVITNNAGEWKS
jgi:hypothetical protein